MNISRRVFLKLSMALGATAVSAGVFSNQTKSSLLSQVEAASKEEQLVTTAGGHNCGGRCLITAHVSDGVVTGITTDPLTDSPDYPALKACLRCRSYRNRMYHPDRLKYPMKRVGKRGEGKFEKISWEEAADIIADNIKRIKAQYGPEAFYVPYATGHDGALAGADFMCRLLAINGGYLNYYNNYSNSCNTWGLKSIYGTENTANSREDYVNSKLIILWGHNPAETIFGTNTMYFLRLAKDRGAKIIVIDPRYSDTTIAFADQWIPIKPTTDNALMDAMAYVMLTSNLHDQAFLDKYCLGFDESHMPPGAPPNSSYRSYVMGLGEDRTPKTPEWAEAITGVPAHIILQLAREYALTKPAALLSGYGPQRHAYGEHFSRGMAVLTAMTGNIGKSGGSAGAMGWPGYGRRPKFGGVGIDNPVKASIPTFLWTDAVIRGTEMSKADGLQGAERLTTNIKMIFNIAGNSLVNQHSNINRTAEILRDESKVECIVVSENFMTASARFADILLPGNMPMERNDVINTWAFGDSTIYMHKAVDSLYGSRSDYEWITMVAERLGLKAKFTEDKSEEDWVRHVVKQIQTKNPGFPDYEEFKAKGVYRFKYRENFIAFKEQIEDFDAHKFPTPSGQIEIFSLALYAMNNPKEIPAIPKYVPAWEGPEDLLIKKYPLQCIGHHYRRRVHSTFDNVPWMEEVAKQEVWLNTQDAAKRAIKNGDKVKVFNERGAMVIPARVTSCIMPGVISVPQGAWYTPDANGVDQRGCINVLTNHRATPLAHANPQHTNLVEVIKA